MIDLGNELAYLRGILRDARSVFKRSLELDKLPLLKKPICQWNNQNWQIDHGRLILPVCLDGKTKQIEIACADVELSGLPGLLRIKKKRDKWIAESGGICYNETR